jgi:hypothetical protein
MTPRPTGLDVTCFTPDQNIGSYDAKLAPSSWLQEECAMETNAQAAKRSLADEVTRLSDTIHSCERLCLLTARTVLRCAVSLDEAGEKTPVTFIPSVSRELQNFPGETRPAQPHPTTSAHCVTALQNLLPVIGRFQLGTHESKGLAFHPIERDSLDTFKPKAVSGEMRDIIVRALKGLEEQNDPGRSTFPELHPFRASQVLRAIAPSHAIFQPIAWRSLFAVVWYLNRRSGTPRGVPNIQATDSPGTAFLTSKCVEAIEKVLSVFERRRERFKRLFELMIELRSIVGAQEQLKKLEDGELISEPRFHHGYRFKTAVLIPEVRACLAELASDSALPETYRRWHQRVASSASSPATAFHEIPADDEKHLSHAEYEKSHKSAADFLQEVIIAFSETVRRRVDPDDSTVTDEHDGAKKGTERSVDAIAEMVGIVERIHAAIDAECKKKNEIKRRDPDERTTDQASANSGARPDSVTRDDLSKLPEWICSEDYWVATRRVLGLDESREFESDAILDTLEIHWMRHRDAAENALKTVRAFQSYLEAVLGDLTKMAEAVTGTPAKVVTETPGRKSIDDFLAISGEATRYILALRQQLRNDLDAGVRWAEVVMNRHLAYAAGGAMTQFDPSELAHAVRVMCHDSGRVRFALIIRALQVVAEAQRADGTWSCQQPFYWRETGFALWTMSIETASAVVSTVHMLVSNPERYGAGPAEVTTGLQPIYEALDRFFRWLSGSIQSFPAPPPLLRAKQHVKSTSAAKSEESAVAASPQTKRADPPLYGWCSDRLPDLERIHSWATAIAIEFLVEFRRLNQVRINALLRAKFLSHHPSELTRLSEVEPTDLQNVRRRDKEGPVIALLMKLLREHKKLELAEGPWAPAPPSEAKISFWSALLYGPPGTSKTFLAKAIAGELGWPLISVSPSDFLANGDAHIESTAREIFSAFSAGSRLVFFFDEIDELIRDRRQNSDQRSALSFLTPSFLAKLQDFRDAAERNEFIFILATNYKDRIDSAAIRSGRIDQLLRVVYPDSESRSYIIVRELAQKSKKRDVVEQFRFIETYLRNIHACLGWDKGSFLDELAEHTGFLSYQKIRALLKLLPGKTFKPGDPTARSELERLKREVQNIGKEGAGTYKPEISLAAYAERPAAFGEEVCFLTKVIPGRRPSWEDDQQAAKSLLEAELGQLYDKICSKKETSEAVLGGFKSKFGPVYARNRWKPPWPEGSDPARAVADLAPGR